jgi:3-deoxy-7-phosphoheptulonate synthase
MDQTKVRNINIEAWERLSTPNEIRDEIKVSDEAYSTVTAGRQAVRDILTRASSQKLLVVGPCSIHDPKAALEYAGLLKDLQKEVNKEFLLVMRVYFEKPRTTTGWKGYINDPELNDTFEIDKGLRKARTLLAEITGMGIPVGTEALDPITPQYIDDLISWSAIGARTVESQTHREMASGLSSPVGFKNGTDGNTDVMVNAIKAVSHPHHFLGIDRDGRCSVFRTSGNQFAHAVLRGGGGPNYDSVNVKLVESALKEAGLTANIMVDCSHGNSSKDPKRQPLVFQNCIDQILEGSESVIGMMIESNLKWGNQPLKDTSELEYGVSITDACIDWDTTVAMIREAAVNLR